MNRDSWPAEHHIASRTTQRNTTPNTRARERSHPLHASTSTRSYASARRRRLPRSHHLPLSTYTRFVRPRPSHSHYGQPQQVVVPGATSLASPFSPRQSDSDCCPPRREVKQASAAALYQHYIDGDRQTATDVLACTGAYSPATTLRPHMTNEGGVARPCHTTCPTRSTATSSPLHIPRPS